jgi:hypothetical protein
MRLLVDKKGLLIERHGVRRILVASQPVRRAVVLPSLYDVALRRLAGSRGPASWR